MSRRRAGTRGPLLVSFSGIDGAGKSTQIQMLCDHLREAGAHVRVVVFWDDVAVLTRFREFSSHTLFRGDPGVGSPGSPVNRRDKNVRSWYMTLLRFCLYFLDAISLSLTVSKLQSSGADVVVFDRYLCDELANLSLNNFISRAYVRLLLKLIPRPDVAYVLDADPVQAHQRKPEYPVDFVEFNRAAYLVLSRLADMIVLAPGSVSEVSRCIMHEFQTKYLELQGHCVATAPLDFVSTSK
jgi:thymidylate kinase